VIPYQRLAVLQPILAVLLVVAGLSFATYGLWMIYHPLGWIAAGVFCICAEMVISDRPRR
jgi:hypothetical protein